jgi:hypothetical protein
MSKKKINQDCAVSSQHMKKKSVCVVSAYCVYKIERIMHDVKKKRRKINQHSAVSSQHMNKKIPSVLFQLPQQLVASAGTTGIPVQQLLTSGNQQLRVLQQPVQQVTTSTPTNVLIQPLVAGGNQVRLVAQPTTSSVQVREYKVQRCLLCVCFCGWAMNLWYNQICLNGHLP